MPLLISGDLIAINRYNNNVNRHLVKVNSQTMGKMSDYLHLQMMLSKVCFLLKKIYQYLNSKLSLTMATSISLRK